MSRLSQAAPARKEAIPAKVLLSGPSGSGKTYSALLAAAELAGDGEVLVIDTERRSAALYADLTTFTHLDWQPPYDPRELGDTITEAGSKYAVIVIDSSTHYWSNEGGTLSIVDAAGARARGNSYAGWKEGTPAQQGLYEAILAAPCHVICTVRSKTEYVLETDSRGKQVPRKVGMAPIQRDGIEYEFTAQLDLDYDHNAIVGKTRCPLLADQVYGKGKTTAWARTLLDWLNDGAAPPPPEPCPVEGCQATARNKAAHIPHLLEDHGWTASGGKVHPPATPQQGRSDDDATAEGDAARPGASAAMVSPAKTGDREASEQSPTTARAGKGEGPAAGAAPRTSRPSSPVSADPPAADAGGSPSRAPAGDPGGESGGVVPSTTGSPSNGPSPKQLGMIHATLKRLGVPEDDKHRYCSALLDLPEQMASLSDLNGRQTRSLIDALLAEETGVSA